MIEMIDFNKYPCIKVAGSVMKSVTCDKKCTNYLYYAENSPLSLHFTLEWYMIFMDLPPQIKICRCWKSSPSQDLEESLFFEVIIAFSTNGLCIPKRSSSCIILWTLTTPHRSFLPMGGTQCTWYPCIWYSLHMNFGLVHNALWNIKSVIKQ